MASLKSSRSRGASHTGGAVKGSSKEVGTKFEENLNVFKSDNFDADTFVQSKCQSLSEKATLVHNLAEGVHIDSLSDTDLEGSAANKASNDEVGEPSDVEKWSRKFPDFLDVLLAERRVDEALASLDEGERIVSEAKEKKTLTPGMLLSLQSAIIERRQKDGPRAHSLLLNAHYQRYQYNTQSLRPSSTSYGGAYTAALSQLVFSAIAQAVSDSLVIFGKETAYASERIEESTAALAAADDWKLTYPSTASRQSGRTPAALGGMMAHQHKLSSSAHRFNVMVQDFFEDVGPLLSMQLGSTPWMILFLLKKELYAKLNRMAAMGADMFVARERFAMLLLMRLTETVILWLSEDQTFWDDSEEGPRPLCPLGLQQCTSGR
ncbi:Hypothetical predicted protein [Olea europaea subsp. europaea]|uniref:Exocyst component Exo84 C-terminal domain-containing protein n=1 Tax=Olea europaea subsp. europaea TaxID=158383 RepID=A0A8S0SG90_OLEEU|nr:Hypothetical predicted protein [Olea europaea subsp. europaea]